MLKSIIKVLRLTFLLFTISQTEVKASKIVVVDVTKHGVVADTNVVNTKAIQKLIDDYSKKGGAILMFPAGKYVSGTILLKDSINGLLFYRCR